MQKSRLGGTSRELDVAPGKDGQVGNTGAEQESALQADFIAPLLGDGDSSDASVDELVPGMDRISIQEDSSTDDLESFRNQWKRELKKGKAPAGYSDSASASHDQENEVKAKCLFQEGVELERRGEMAEAVSRFSRAVKLVPDIERRLFPPAAKPARARSLSSTRSVKKDSDEPSTVLRDQLLNRIMEQGRHFDAEVSNSDCPLQRVPVELLRLLIRYLVGQKLNSRAVETLSQVSSMFYVLCREEELWRSILSQSVGSERSDELFDEESDLGWRQLYLDSPHLLYDGIYVSKSTYIRHGDMGYQDQNYRPWHTVTYYRLMRFYADGHILMTTSSEVPQSSVSLLRSRVPQRGDGSNNVLVGRWTIENGYDVVAVVSRETDYVAPSAKPRTRRNREEIHVEYGIKRHSFSLRLRLERRGLRWGMHWLENVCTITYMDGRKSTNDLDADKDSQAFPPLRYYRVKSFAEGYDDKMEV